MNLTTPLKIKSMIPSYVLLRTIQLLFEIFFRIYHSCREILMHYLKWDTLYTYIKNCIYLIIKIYIYKYILSTI